MLSLRDLPVRRTHAGVARFPDLNRPDTKFKTEGEYKVGMIFDDAGLEDVKEVIREVRAQAKAEAEEKAAKTGKEAKPADLPVRPEMKKIGPGEYEDTGRKVANFKSTASGKRQDGTTWERKLPLFDAKGSPLAESIGGGSTLKVAYKAVPWVNPKCEYGVKLQIEAVQVISLVQYGERGASGYGFDEEEGYSSPAEASYGFSSEDTPTPAASGPVPADEDEDF